ncbi:hypothetical protein [Fibrobacter sp. UWB11]|uniref:hypothetical protein n=1 Tax=Fibrobacter sp. UWB11 TaxID=1896202 RepID=UPI0015880A78|nr:hypothetical protein [Fibrobacter sp. UWB11]
MMSFKSAVLTMFAALYFAACSDNDEGVVIARIDENGYQYSPMSLSVVVEYLPTMKPSAVRIEVVDDQLNTVDTIELSKDTSAWMGKYFSMKSQDIKYPYLKIITEFPYGKNSKVEFTQYNRLSSETRSTISQNIYMALASSRIEHFVKKENYSFADAEDTVMEEMSERFGLNANRFMTYEFPSSDIRLNDLLLYVMCRHEISDSLFVSDFKKLREYYAEKSFVDTAMAIAAADAWLSTFENIPNERTHISEFESVSRDTSVKLRYMEKDFFSQIYEIKFTTKDSVMIDKKSSAYYGKYFYYDNEENDRYSSKWRFKNPIEDTLGLCLLKTKSLVTYKGNEYLCDKGSNIWRKNVSHDELLDSYYEVCEKSNNGDAVYTRDSLFICECDKSGNCAWSDKYAGKEVPRKDSTAFAKYIEAKAVEQFGRCYTNGYGATKKLDDLYIQCISSKWLEVDSLTYHIGHCAKDRVKGEYNGTYYGCRVFTDYDASDTVWAEIPWPVYAGEQCSVAGDLKKVTTDSTNYFICEKSSEGNDVSDVVYKWRKLDSAEAIPPVINMDTCGVNQYNMKKAYDGEFYMCFIGGWSHVKKESLLPIEQAGFLCSIKDYGLVKGYQGAYYICNTSNQWIELNASSAAPYKYKDSLGTCDTISHKTIVWNEEAGAFYSCQTVDKKYTWSTAPMSASPNDSIPSYLDKRKFAGGVVDGDSVYTVTVDGNKYTFRRYNSNIYKWVLDNVEISGTVYDASFYKDNLFIRGKRGAENVQLNLIENKSASFDAFYEDWKTRATGYSECSTQKAEVKDASVLAYHFNDNSYMDFAHASQFCPKGFRLLKAEEFTNSIIDITYSALGSQSVWTYEMDSGENCSGGNLVSNFFWTSDETDSETQKCYEDDRINTPAGSKSKKSIVDCPKDLYPMVQALCIKER